MTKPKFRMLNSRYYEENVPLVALDYYDRDSHGEDDFSRKQVWFYTYGDKEIEQRFREDLGAVFRKLFSEDGLDWDMITLYPAHAEGTLNTHMMSLVMDVAGDVGIPVEQVIRRTETVSQNHEIEKEKAKVVNLEGSLEVLQDLKGKNVILVDNIVLSGVSMLNGASALKKKGAENVFSISLGTSRKHKEETRELSEDATALDLIQSGR